MSLKQIDNMIILIIRINYDNNRELLEPDA